MAQNILTGVEAEMHQLQSAECHRASRAGSPSCWRRYRLVLKMRATPASVSTHVSAHCFSAVSREWWIRMFPPPDSIFSLSAVVEDVLTQSSSWNRTWRRRVTKQSRTVKFYIFSCFSFSILYGDVSGIVPSTPQCATLAAGAGFRGQQ